MGRWVFMLGGLIVWTVHFFGVYALASLGDVVSAADDPAWRAAVAGFSAVCLALAVGLAWHAARRLRRGASEPGGRLVPEVAAYGAGLAAVAILWQALPAWIGH